MKTPNGNAGIIDSSITKKTPNNIPVFCKIKAQKKLRYYVLNKRF